MDTFSDKEALARFKEVLADRQGQAVIIVGAEGSGKSLLLNSMVMYAEKSNLHCDCNIHKGGEVKDTNTLLKSIGRWPASTVQYINAKTVLERLSESVKEFGDVHRRVVGVEAELTPRNSVSVWHGIVENLGDKVKFIFTQRPDDVLAKNETFMKLPNVVRINLKPQKTKPVHAKQAARTADGTVNDESKKGTRSMAKIFDDRWKVVKQIGEGGQAHIFKVSDMQSGGDSHFILKRLKNQNRIARFQQEIEANQKLNHPAIASVVDYSLENQAYFVMPYVAETTLEGASPLSPLQAISVLVDLCDVVAYAHEQGVVHRDLKPENVILADDGQIVVLDFGLCYFVNQDQRFTATMEQIGSRFYMAPELESGKADEVTPAVDVYALGKILYFLLTKRHIARELFRGDNELSKFLSDPQLAYITNNILSRSIVEDPEQRAGLSDLKANIKKVQTLLVEHYYPGIIGTKCRFCGEGVYEFTNETVAMSIKLGSQIRQKILTFVVCTNCTNIQWFGESPKERS